MRVIIMEISLKQWGWRGWEWSKGWALWGWPGIWNWNAGGLGVSEWPKRVLVKRESKEEKTR